MIEAIYWLWVCLWLVVGGAILSCDWGDGEQ